MESLRAYPARRSPPARPAAAVAEEERTDPDLPAAVPGSPTYRPRRGALSSLPLPVEPPDAGEPAPESAGRLPPDREGLTPLEAALIDTMKGFSTDVGVKLDRLTEEVKGLRSQAPARWHLYGLAVLFWVSWVLSTLLDAAERGVDVQGVAGAVTTIVHGTADAAVPGGE